jgi:hypothetical protein
MTLFYKGTKWTTYINNYYMVVMNDEVEPECKLTAGLIIVAN